MCNKDSSLSSDISASFDEPNDLSTIRTINKEEETGNNCSFFSCGSLIKEERDKDIILDEEKDELLEIIKDIDKNKGVNIDKKIDSLSLFSTSSITWKSRTKKKLIIKNSKTVLKKKRKKKQK